MRFLGNKTRMLENINFVIKQNKITGRTFCDLFSGSGSVGDYFKEKYNITDERQLNTWCNKSIYMRVKIVSEEIPEILELYYIIYKKNCEYVHPFVQSLSQYVIYNNGNIEVNYQNNYNKDKFYLIKQVNSLVKIFSIKFEKKYGNATLADIDFQK